MGPFEFRKGDAREEQQFHYGQEGDDEFKQCCSADSIDVECSEYEVGDDGNGENGKFRSEEIEIGANGKCNGGGSEDEFDGLRHSGYESPIVAECSSGIIKSSACLRNGAGQFRVAEGEGGIQDNNDSSCNGQSTCPPFFQSQVPPKIHTRDHVAHAQAPEKERGEGSFEVLLFHCVIVLSKIAKYVCLPIRNFKRECQWYMIILLSE